MKLKYLKDGDRFKTEFTERIGTVIEAGLNTIVKWEGEKIKKIGDIQFSVPNKNEIISSETEVNIL